MKSYKELHQLIEQHIGELPLDRQPAELYDPIRYMLSLGGKRLRPVLVLMANDLFSGKVNEAVNIALAVEVFHNFTLVHDDIMDQALLRRGMPSVHSKWNQAVAILSGDLMMIKATSLLCEAPGGNVMDLMRLFNRTATEVCEGQQIDMNFESRDDVTREEYLHMITLKTAVLLGCALKLGAIAANAPDDQGRHAYEFGKNIGIAFQIQDDMLDAFGEGEQTGKKVGGDIAANKKTLLLIEAFMHADPSTRIELKNWLGRKGDDERKIEAVLRIYEGLNVRGICEKLKDRYLQLAFTHLDQIQVDESRKQVLRSTARELMERIS